MYVTYILIIILTIVIGTFAIETDFKNCVLFVPKRSKKKEKTPWVVLRVGYLETTEERAELFVSDASPEWSEEEEEIMIRMT